MTADPAPTPSPFSSGAPGEFRGRWRRCGHRRGHGIIPGLVVIVWGGLLLLGELGLLPVHVHALDFWPLLLVGGGLSMILRWRSAGSALIGLAVGALGAGLLAQRLGYPIAGVEHLWPVVVIAIGVGLVWKGSTRRHGPHHRSETLSADQLQREVTMGGLALVVDSQQFRGGALSVTMGEVRADLRRAAISGDEAVLELSVAMGGVELYVPTNWVIVNEVSPFIGAVEDKTEPRPDLAGVQKRLVLRGKLSVGAVTVTN